MNPANKNPATSGNETAWRLCVALVIATLVVTYSPLVLTPSETAPWILGLPRTLWAGFASAVLLVLLTIVGVYVRPSTAEDNS